MDNLTSHRSDRRKKNKVGRWSDEEIELF